MSDVKFNEKNGLVVFLDSDTYTDNGFYKVFSFNFMHLLMYVCMHMQQKAFFFI